MRNRPCADARYLERVQKELVEAVCQADKCRAEVHCGIGKGIEDKVAFNRRFRMKNGLSHTHPGQLNPDIVEPAGPIDPEVGIIGAWDAKGKCVGCVVNYCCHATCNPGGISANWIYYLEQTIRGAHGARLHRRLPPRGMWRRDPGGQPQPLASIWPAKPGRGSWAVASAPRPSRCS